MDDIKEQIRHLLDQDLTSALTAIYDGDTEGAALRIKTFARKVKFILDGEFES